MVSHLAQNLHCFALEEAAWLHHYVMLTSDPCKKTSLCKGSVAAAAPALGFIKTEEM